MKTSRYHLTDVLIRRPYLQDQWIEAILVNPIKTEVQSDGRVRYWGYVEGIGKYVRVVTEPDGETVHNAFPDRRFRP
ncbi:MAG: hypothetical protein O2909_04930 [Chloroflexi bacterium]|nr:hypothetical protein [Chloroflexota bacterium]MDA1218768.1 hypothetical protein [Chloroflexota bacterium]